MTFGSPSEVAIILRRSRVGNGAAQRSRLTRTERGSSAPRERVIGKDNAFFLERGGRKWPDSDVLDQTPIAGPTVFRFEGRTGRLLGIWGRNAFALPHGLTVDLKDNIWVTDVAWHQVFKFSHDGRLLLTLGERGKPGDDSSHFNRPTEVAVAPDESFYVSDGYGNSRVLKFAADGTFLFQWGTKGKEPGQLDVQLPR